MPPFLRRSDAHRIEQPELRTAEARMKNHSTHTTDAEATPLPPAIVFHGLDQAMAALAAAAALGVPVTLLSAPGAASYAGAGWFRAVVEQAQAAHPDAEAVALLDCGDQPGHALAALREGVTAIRFSGITADKIEDIAARYGARMVRDRPESLDLQEVSGDPIAACRAWLGAHTK